MSARPLSVPEASLWRERTQRWQMAERHRPRLSTGEGAMDRVLAGGWPVGKVAELVGPGSSGKTSLAVATVRAATTRGELVLWVDVSGQFDGVSIAGAGVVLERLLLVQAKGLEQAVRAVELVLEAGGFTVAVVDVAGEEGSGFWGKQRSHLPLRLARAVERAGVVGIVLATTPWVGTWAGVQVVFAPGTPRFVREEGGGYWFAGFQTEAWVERG
ncbi:MAG: hypothetical protein NZ869_04725, partial [Thermoanaerobaculum sp.]|nr:hypothetical protein [Thermoanaerobaculum sp.]MDW7968600.1 hypothetical protein [Thermoanaerobaculum sp.]